MLTSGTCSGNHRASTQGSQPGRLPGGDHPSPAFRKRETRGTRGDHEVAGERDLEAAAERRTFDRGDQRLGPTAPDQAVLPAAPGVSAAVFQVGAGREHRRRAGDDAGPQFVIVVEQVERLVNAVGSDPVNGVALGLTLDADDEDPPRRS